MLVLNTPPAWNERAEGGLAGGGVARLAVAAHVEIESKVSKRFIII
jgi:hypothetical protein